MMEAETVENLFAKSGLMAKLSEAATAIQTWEAYLPEFSPDEQTQVDEQQFAAVFKKFLARMEENHPFFHPLYAGQMVKPPHPVAMLGYISAMFFNPNNHAMEGGPATSKMEKECVAQFAERFGFDHFIGHLTSGGTIANLEALWMAREIHPDKAIAASAQAHYTHNRMSALLKVPFVPIQTTPQGQLDLADLKHKLQTEKIGTVVVTLGSTGLGALDPLDEILALKKEFDFRIHVDMAYGGYFHLLSETDPDFSVCQHIASVDSLVIDPHKQGLQPYGCGCILFNQAYDVAGKPDIRQFYHHDSPYTYFSQQDSHLGEISLECSRPGASAAALWLTLQCFPLTSDGMGKIVAKNRQAALDFVARLPRASDQYQIYCAPQTDIVTYFPTAQTTADITQRSKTIYRSAMNNADFPLYVVTLQVSADDLIAMHPGIEKNSEQVTILRSCFLKPEHADWIPQITQVLALQAHIHHYG